MILVLMRGILFKMEDKRMNFLVNDVLEVVNWFKVKNFSDMKDDQNVEPISQMKIMKLLYYVQGVTLAVYGEKMFRDDLLAWKYGPVVKRVYDEYHGQYAIVDPFSDGMPEKEIKDYESLSQNKKVFSVLNAVEKEYGGMSAIDLMNKTHQERPWRETLQSDVIQDELIKEYFLEEIVSV